MYFLLTIFWLFVIAFIAIFSLLYAYIWTYDLCQWVKRTYKDYKLGD